MYKKILKILFLIPSIILYMNCELIDVIRNPYNKLLNDSSLTLEISSKLIDNSSNNNINNYTINNLSAKENPVTLESNENISNIIQPTILPNLVNTTISNNNENLTTKTVAPNIAKKIIPPMSLEQQLIPPANVTPNIGHQDSTNESNMHLYLLDSDCPSLQNADKLSQTQLLERLTHGCRYDRLERPISNINGTVVKSPVAVHGRAYIYFMQNLEAHDLQFKIHALLQLRFVDPRLAFKSVSPLRKQPILGEAHLREKLWIPHIFFANERDSNILGTDVKDVLTSISPDGTVIISQRIQATLYCWMNLQKFPFDKQKCSTILESWMYTIDELILYWEEKSPITLSPDFHLTEFSLLNITQSEEIVNADLSDLRHGAFGNYSSLTFTIYLEREMGFYLMDYFLPSMMIVAISWVSFWLQADQSAPRIMLGTSTMLTFITLASAQGKTLPKVSYIKVSEIWFLGCTGFIFGSLVEFAFVNTIWRRKKNIELKEKNSKYILKATLTPRPARKEMNTLHKSRSCSSLDGSANILNEPNGPSAFDNYLTVHSFHPKPTSIPVIRTESCDDLSLTNQNKDNGHININMEPMNKSTQNMISGSAQASTDEVNRGWTTMTPQEISIWIDRRSRLLFPSAFIVFNFFFWTFVLLL